MQRHRQVPSRRAAAPGQTAVRRHCRSRGPGLRGGPVPPREETFNRVSARRAGSVTRHPQARPRPAAMWPPAAGRLADRTALMPPAGLAADSSLPLAGQRAAPPCRPCVAGRWRVRRSRAARNSRFWCLSFAGLFLPRSHCLRCSGRRADSCPRRGEILSLAVSCCWRQSQRGWQRGPGQRASPAGNRARQSPTSAAAGRRGRCRRGQPGKRAL
jgi:hypothetical protein